MFNSNGKDVLGKYITFPIPGCCCMNLNIMQR